MNHVAFYCLPEIFLLVGAFLILGLDYGIWKGVVLVEARRYRVFGIAQIVLGAAILGAGGLLWRIGFEPSGWQMGMWKLNALTLIFKIFLFGLTWGAIRMAEEEPILQMGERAALFLLGSIGIGVVLSSNHLLLLFVGLETFAIAIYALAILGKKEADSTASAFQFFVTGSVAAAFFFYGMGLLDGASRSLYFGVIQSILELPSMPMIPVAIGCLMVGIGFKLAIAPFHFWAPDFYRSAPLSVTAWIAGASKALGAYVLAVIWLMLYRGEPLDLALRKLFFILCVMSLLVGNFGALLQNHLGRLMAFSSVAHGGYLLMATQAATVHGAYAMIYHALTYGPAALTVFMVLSKTAGITLDSLKGLGHRSPAAAIYLSIAILSLAGIPPLGGFFSKYYLFVSSVATYPIWGWNFGLLALALGMTAIGLYYYLQILKRIWIFEATESPVVRFSWIDHFLLVLLQILIIGLGLLPDLVIGWLARSGW